MSKIVQAINVMLQHPKNISKVIRSGEADLEEYYFLYKDYKWSILYNKSENNYRLFYYPGKDPIEVLVALNYPESQGEAYIMFSSKDIGTKEALSTFQELYQAIQTKLYHVDEVLDDIIKEKDEIEF